ncbi:MAG TPA: neutral zinc metallopeptidase [Gammaproteobacteria bacterium]|nr:neutral zinc metallopeptidase [Gammaproteobacteria bacterium]
MRWRDLRRSSNVQDARGAGPARSGMPIRIGRGGGGIAVLALLAVAYFVGGPDAVNQLLGGGAGAPDSGSAPPLGADDEASQFVAAVLGSTEDVWGEIFAQSGATYYQPELTLFDGEVRSACGFATSAVGPFYCPSDRHVYLDTAFFRDLAALGGPGEFAQAYVIGHEVGHHVQTLLGKSDRVRGAQQRGDANGMQVAMELQADCYAGVWAYHANRTHRILEPGDVEDALAAAQAIGDDRLQRNAGRRVTPDSFTHGSSAQRQRWLRTGLETGDPNACDTFR